MTAVPPVIPRPGEQAPTFSVHATRLPFTLTGTEISLVFDPDPLAGARLTRLEHPEDCGHFAFAFLPQGSAARRRKKYQDWRLWELTCTLQSGKEVTVHPGQGWKNFTALAGRTDEGTPCAVFQWQGVAIPQAPDGDTLDVEVQVTLAEDDRLSRWWARVTRVRGRSASIDRVDLPVLLLEGPVQPQPGGSHIDAQKGARVLLPQNFFETTTFFSQNAPLWLWIASGAAHDLDHPGYQTMQFSAVAAMDPADPKSFRRMLYFGTEDTEGFVKRFLYRGVQRDGKGAIELRARHLPAYCDDPVRGDRKGLGNSYASPYPTVLGAVHARSDAFWYDACAQYREFVERSGLGGPKRKHNTELSSLRANALLVGHIQYQPVKTAAELLYSFLQSTSDIAQALGTPPRPDRPVFMHWQNALTNGRGADNPEYPAHQSMEPDARALATLAFRQGIRTSCYSEGLHVPRRSRWRRFLKPADQIHRRDGTLLMPEVFRFDFGSENAQRFPAEHMMKDMAELCRLSGFYVDGVSGVFNFLAYDPPGSARPAHAPHGGSYVTQGKVRMFDNLRAMLRRTGPGQTPDGDPEVFLMSEVIQEYLVGHLDFAQEGYLFIPNHMLLAEEAAWASSLVPLGIERAPVEARNMSPPLWTAVYNEWSCTARLTIPLSSNGLATNFRRYPVGPYPGLSAAEWVDLLVFLHAAPFMVGIGWMLAHIENLDPMFRLVEGRVEVDETIDPERTAVPILEAIGAMARAQQARHAGEFLSFGRMERPLPVDHSDPQVRLLPNPVRASRKGDPRDYGSVYPSYMHPFDPGNPFKAGQTWASASFPVVQVLHSVWRSDAGRLGLLFCNWSGEEGSWRGEFDPELYGWQRGERIRLLRRNADGSEEPLGLLRRKAVLRLGPPQARERRVFELGPLPPRSLLLIVAERADG